ncbi:MAG: hypothetical protein JNK16_15105 [Phycisphaerales bacterium]|nr:hypothetical protein [Phycisphaerales bacterium]
MGEPPSRREGKKLRASTAPLLQLWMIGAAITGGIGLYGFGLFALVVPLWISLPALLIADGGSVLLWWWGKLPGWARE